MIVPISVGRFPLRCLNCRLILVSAVSVPNTVRYMVSVGMCLYCVDVLESQC